jgi:hypothetical protein
MNYEEKDCGASTTKFMIKCERKDNKFYIKFTCYLREIEFNVANDNDKVGEKL